MAFRPMTDCNVTTDVADLQEVAEKTKKQVRQLKGVVAKADPLVINKPIPVSAFKSIEAEEFCEGSDSLSLWLVPTGYVYDTHAQSWVSELGDC